MKTNTVFCLYDDGNHIDCFTSYEAAEQYAIENLSRYWDIEEEDFDPHCDCGNHRLHEEAYDAWYDLKEAEMKGN